MIFRAAIALAVICSLPETLPAAERDGSVGIPIAKVKHSGPVDFEKEVLPILKNNCLACHNQTKPKGGLVLETPQTILKGGDSGPAVVRKKPAASLLLKAAAHQDEELIMPPPDNKVAAVALKPNELGLIQLWIEQGAKGEVRAAAPVAWQAMPFGVNAIYSVALTRDGQFAACGRGNQLFVYHLPTTQLVARLSDVKLSTAHRDTVNSLAFSPDGELLASGGYREVKLWRRSKPAETLKLVQRSPIQAVDVSADGKRIAIATNGQVALWTSSGKALRTLNAASGVSALKFSPDGEWLAVLATNSVFVLSAGGASLAALALPTNATVLAWLDRTNIAVGAADGVIRLCVITEGSNTLAAGAELKGHTGKITGLAVSGTNLLSGSGDGSARGWDAGERRGLFEVKQDGPVLDVAFRGDGKTFATAGTNGGKLWKLEDSKVLAELKGDPRLNERAADAEREVTFAKAEVEFHKGAVKAAETNQTTVAARHKKATETNAAVAKVMGEKQTAVTNALASQHEAEQAIDELGPDVRKLVETFFAAERESTNAIALAKTAKDTSSKDAEKLAADVLSKSNLLVTAKTALDALPAETKAKQKLATDKSIAAKKAVADAEKELKKVETSKSGTENELHLATEALRRADEKVTAARQQLVSTESAATNVMAAGEMARQKSRAAEATVRSVKFSPNGRFAFTLTEAGTVQSWAADTGAACDTFPEMENVRAIAPLSGGGLLVVTADSASVWDVEPRWTLERVLGSGDGRSPIADRVNALRFTPDGQQLITGGGEPTRGGEIKLWRVADGAQVRELNNVHSDSVFALDVSADGKYLVSGAADRFARVTDLESGKVVRAFEGHTHHVLGVALSRSARTLMTAGADNVVKVWDFTNGERKKNVDGFSKEASSVSFVGIEQQAIVTAGDGQVVLVTDAGNKPRAFSGASDYVYSAATTPDGRVVVAGGADGVLRVWNGTDSKLLASFAFPETRSARN